MLRGKLLAKILKRKKIVKPGKHWSWLKPVDTGQFSAFAFSGYILIRIDEMMNPKKDSVLIKEKFVTLQTAGAEATTAAPGRCAPRILPRSERK